MRIPKNVRAGFADDITEVTITQTYATTTTTVPAAQAATLTGTLTGSTNGALEDIADVAISSSGGNTYADSTVNTAVNVAVTAANLQIKELMVMVNKLTSDALTNRQLINTLTDILQDAGLAV